MAKLWTKSGGVLLHIPSTGCRQGVSQLQAWLWELQLTTVVEENGVLHRLGLC
jgi:hypothetical protein